MPRGQYPRKTAAPAPKSPPMPGFESGVSKLVDDLRDVVAEAYSEGFKDGVAHVKKQINDLVK